MSNTYRGMEIEDPEFRCSNCDGSGYFDTPDDGEKICTVCRGKGAYTQEEVDALTGHTELTAAVRAHLSAYGNDRLFKALEAAEATTAACHMIMAQCRTLAGDPTTDTVSAIRGLVLRAETAETQRDEAHARVATLQSWIAAACNADHTLLPPKGIEITHRVAPTAHDCQDDSKE